jgi:hypothetical protein
MPLAACKVTAAAKYKGEAQLFDVATMLNFVCITPQQAKDTTILSTQLTHIICGHHVQVW